MAKLCTSQFLLNIFLDIKNIVQNILRCYGEYIICVYNTMYSCDRVQWASVISGLKHICCKLLLFSCCHTASEAPIWAVNYERWTFGRKNSHLMEGSVCRTWHNFNWYAITSYLKSIASIFSTLSAGVSITLIPTWTFCYDG